MDTADFAEYEQKVYEQYQEQAEREIIDNLKVLLKKGNKSHVYKWLNWEFHDSYR